MNGAKYVVWRDGRPRFTPSPQLRADGHRSRDLRHPDGTWFTFDEAAAWARKFLDALPRHREIERRPRGRKSALVRRGRGFVYFLWVGEMLKIGYSANPAGRLFQLLSANGEPVRMFISFPGERADEKRLHRRLAHLAARGEWFRVTSTTLEVMRMEIEKATGLEAP